MLVVQEDVIVYTFGEILALNWTPSLERMVTIRDVIDVWARREVGAPDHAATEITMRDGEAHIAVAWFERG